MSEPTCVCGRQSVRLPITGTLLCVGCRVVTSHCLCDVVDEPMPQTLEQAVEVLERAHVEGRLTNADRARIAVVLLKANPNARVRVEVERCPATKGALLCGLTAGHSDPEHLAHDLSERWPVEP